MLSHPILLILPKNVKARKCLETMAHTHCTIAHHSCRQHGYKISVHRSFSCQTMRTKFILVNLLSLIAAMHPIPSLYGGFDAWFGSPSIAVVHVHLLERKEEYRTCHHLLLVYFFTA